MISCQMPTRRRLVVAQADHLREPSRCFYWLTSQCAKVAGSCFDKPLRDSGESYCQMNADNYRQHATHQIAQTSPAGYY